MHTRSDTCVLCAWPCLYINAVVRYAKRNDLVERVAMQQNLPGLKFKDARLAAAFGKSTGDFDALPVSKAAIDVVFDALAQSKSSLLKQELADERKATWITAEGGIDEGAMATGLYKSRALVCFSWLFLGKGRVVGAVHGETRRLGCTSRGTTGHPQLQAALVLAHGGPPESMQPCWAAGTRDPTHSAAVGSSQSHPPRSPISPVSTT